MASVFIPTTGNICATPRQHQDLCPQDETTDQGTDAIPALAIEGTSTEKVRKTHITVVNPLSFSTYVHLNVCMVDLIYWLVLVNNFNI